MKNKLLLAIPLGLVLAVCVLVWPDGFRVYGQTTQPATYGQALAQFGQSVDATITGLRQQLATAQQQAAAAQQTITALNQQLAALEVPPESDLHDRYVTGGHYRLHAGGHYIVTGSPTCRVDGTEFDGDNTTMELQPAPGASSGVVLAAAGILHKGIVFKGPGLVRYAGKTRPAPPAATQPAAPPDASADPEPCVFVRCTFDGSMIEGLHVQGTAANTAVVDCTYGRTGGCEVYDCGAHGVYAFNTFAGSQGEHCYRAETDGPGLSSDGPVLAYNKFDNRLSPAGKEDVTFRKGYGGYLIGNWLNCWVSITNDGPTVLSRNVFLGLRNGGARVQERPSVNRQIYLDHNAFPGSATSSQVSMFGSGDLLLNYNLLYNCPSPYKQAFAIDGSVPFLGRILDLAQPPQTLIIPATQPATQP